MITIDMSGPSGNVFCILGAAKSVQKQLRREEIENETLNDVLANYTNMTYDGICETLTSTGFFEFFNGSDEGCPFCGRDVGDCDCDPKDS